MADNYLEKRYDAVFGTKTKTKRVGHTLDELLLKNRSTRGYLKDFVVTRDMLMQIVSVNTKIPSGRNAQTLRFRLVTRDSGQARHVLDNVKMGAALPELHLPFPGTEPEAFIIICGTVPENRIVDIDLGISIQSMLLKATELGLSGLTIVAFNKQKLTEDLHLPLEPLAVLAIGKGIEQFRLVPIHPDDSRNYYRENNVHIVPKLTLPDLIIPE